MPPLPEDEELPQRPKTAPVPASRILFITLIVVVVLFALLIAMGIAGYVFYRMTGSEPQLPAPTTIEKVVK